MTMSETTPQSDVRDVSAGESTSSFDGFDVLTNEPRCVAIEYLAECSGPVDVDELVGYVSAVLGTGGEGSRGHERATVRFHHVHFPKMTDAGLVEYDSDAGTVEPTEKINVALDLLELDGERPSE